jgi:hypothetical protein
MQRGLGQIRDGAQTDAANSFSIRLCGDNHQSLAFGQPADGACLHAAPIGFIHFDDAVQAISSRANHGSTQFVQ